MYTNKFKYHDSSLTVGQLYFGDRQLRNTIVYEGNGGRGGGSVKINSRHVQIDGKLSASGISANSDHEKEAGGWSFHRLLSDYFV